MGEIVMNIPFGKYLVELYSMNLTPSDKDEPMVKTIFRIMDGEHAACLLPVIYPLVNASQVVAVNSLLRGLVAAVEGFNIKFESYKQYGHLLSDVMEAVCGKYEYLIDYSEKVTTLEIYPYV
jgi:hypothetical protein